MQPVNPTPLVEPFATRLLAGDFPGLPVERRAEVTTFVCRRIDGLPDFTRLGVLALAAAFRLLIAVPGGWGGSRLILRLPLPFVPEYPRLIRSLAVAYIWERWPDTLPSGSEHDAT
jgi:hypothetical protein